MQRQPAEARESSGVIQVEHDCGEGSSVFSDEFCQASEHSDIRDTLSRQYRVQRLFTRFESLPFAASFSCSNRMPEQAPQLSPRPG